MLLPCTHHLSLVLLIFLHLSPPPFAVARIIAEFTIKPLPKITVNNYQNNDNQWNSNDDKFLDSRGSHVSIDTEDKIPMSFHATENFVYFPGKPRWDRNIPMTLTYAFSPENTINYLNSSEIKSVFKRAFARWASVIPVNFVEIDDYGFADIKVGFYSGDHGDGEPFDGVLGILAHSFSPESGKFHLDAAETWAVDFEEEKSPVAVDLESVALHEIGHLLGLAHTPVKEAVMYPSLKPRDKKVDLAVDDIKGVQALYGSNRNFTFGALSESDTSANRAVHLRMERVPLMLVFIVLLLHAI